VQSAIKVQEGRQFDDTARNVGEDKGDALEMLKSESMKSKAAQQLDGADSLQSRLIMALYPVSIGNSQ
jgi:hypothetical protein